MNNYSVDFCDINLKSYTLDLNKLENKLKKNNRIGAVIAVDYAGHPSQWKDLRYLKNKHEFFLINDNCHALGAKYNNEKHYATKYADLVTQSFHAVKNITTGEGGAILTYNKSYYNDILLMRSHSMIRNKSLSKSYGRWHYKINDIGYNFRLSDIQCALGISQLKKIDLFLNRRREIAKIYNEAFTKKPIFITPETEKKVWLGVIIGKSEKKEFSTSIMVKEVEAGSPAEKAGIKKGDLINSINKKKTKSPIHFIRAMNVLSSGDKVEIELIRDKKYIAKTVTLSSKTFDLDKAEKREAKPYSLGFFGISTRDKKEIRINYYPKKITDKYLFAGSKDETLIVTCLKKGSGSEKAGIKLYDEIISIDGKDIKDTPS